MDVIFEEGPAALGVIRGAFAEEKLRGWLEAIDWQVNQIRIFGRLHDEPRETAWFGPAYRYSSIQWPARPLSPPLVAMRDQVMAHVPDSEAPWHFNSVLLNHYRAGRDHMGWHRDNEPEIDGTWIASVSLGETRDFKVRRRADRTPIATVALGHGDLLLMRHLQEDYEHALPKRLRVEGPRLNFTFRRCVEGLGRG